MKYRFVTGGKKGESLVFPEEQQVSVTTIVKMISRMTSTTSTLSGYPLLRLRETFFRHEDHLSQRILSSPRISRTLCGLQSSNQGNNYRQRFFYVSVTVGESVHHQREETTN